MKIERVELGEVELVAFTLAQTFMAWQEPIPDFNSRYPNVLESCLETPFQSFDGQDLYTRLADKAAILFYLLIKNHPFENGNKRLAVTTLLLFLSNNDHWIDTGVNDLYQFAKSVAESSPENKEEEIKRINAFIEDTLSRFE